MIFHEYDTFGFVARCDRCCSDAMWDNYEFCNKEEAIAFVTDKKSGWHNYKDEHGEWQNICPECWTTLKAGSEDV